MRPSQHRKLSQNRKPSTKRQPKEQENIYLHMILLKWINFKIYKQLTQLNNKKATTHFKKGKGLAFYP